MLYPFLQKGRSEAGVDEAGRGCLAGPVVAAAVILPEDFAHPLLNDSKKLKESDRYALRKIIEKEAVAWAVSFIGSEIIDEVNILNATFLAMNEAVNKLKIRPQHLLIDGNRFKDTTTGIGYSCIVKGDALYASIAAASILAKTYRDDHMLTLHKQHDQYLWNNNKGYPTTDHRQAIEKHGITIHHRKSFRLLPEERQLRLFHE